MKNILIIALSGEIASGKSSLASSFKEKYGFEVLRTKDALHDAVLKLKRKHSDERLDLQKIGEKLDKETNGRWLVQAFQSIINQSKKVIIDSIRIIEQVEELRKAYGYQNVFHIYMDATSKTLEKRFFDRNGWDIHDLNQIAQYKTYKSNTTEKNVRNLKVHADLVIDTETFAFEDNVIRAASFLKLLPNTSNPSVDVLVGGQFGSEGKGQISGYLAPEYDCLIRVGGPNAGHTVYEEPISHTFHNVPSGAKRASNAKIIIGPGAVISLPGLLKEISDFELTPDRFLIDENAIIINQTDIKQEEKLQTIGSTCRGVGSATANNLFKNRLESNNNHKAKNERKLKNFIGSAVELYNSIFETHGKILLEGTQGTMLSLHHGIYPYVTSRDTTASGCLAEAGLSPRRVRKIILVARRYPIRVQSPKNGTSGPFSRTGDGGELKWNEISKRSGIALEKLLKSEKTTTTKKERRVAEFNWALFRESCELNSPTDIALTFTDYISIENRKARRFDQLTDETKKFIDEVERCASVNVSLIATGFNYRSIIDRRNW